MKDIKVMFSKNTDDWKTPTDLYNCFLNNGWVDTFKFMSEDNEFEKEYHGEKLFINPPFSKMEKVADWVISRLEGNIIALLIPSRTDTRYFHKLLTYNPLIIFIKGRLHYNDSKSAPFPSLLLVFNGNPSVRYKYFDQEGLKKFVEGEIYD